MPVSVQSRAAGTSSSVTSFLALVAAAAVVALLVVAGEAGVALDAVGVVPGAMELAGGAGWPASGSLNSAGAPDGEVDGDWAGACCADCSAQLLNESKRKQSKYHVRRMIKLHRINGCGQEYVRYRGGAMRVNVAGRTSSTASESPA